METVSCRLAVLSMLVALASAVGPVMNQQPTIFDLIQNDPDLSEVNEYNSTFFSIESQKVVDQREQTLSSSEWM